MYTKAFYIAVTPVGSKFAKALQQGLENVCHNVVYRVDHQRANSKERLGRKVFRVTPQSLNKIEQLNRFKEHEVSCPAFTTDQAELSQLGSKTVFARTLINSTNGRGIVEFPYDTGNIPAAPLYTAYIPKKAEYRLHVFNGKVIDAQEKRKKRGFEDARNTRVRNCNNGYVYCRDDVVLPENIEALAIKAVQACEYLYGAVDIVYNQKQNKCYVLEVNSRPGLMNTSVEHYCKALVNTFNLESK